MTTASTTTPTTPTTTDLADRHLALIREDLRLYGRSLAADRQLRIDQQDAERAERLAATLGRQQERQVAIVAIRELYWAARGRRTHSRH